MKNSRTAKIIFDKKQKMFYDEEDGWSDNFTDAFLYSFEIPDDDLINEYDEIYRENIEIWQVRILIETI